MKLVILDRDGVINADSPDYIRSPDEWRALPGSLEAVARLCRADYRIVIATNQSAVGRGLIDHDTLASIHARMLERLHQKGGRIDAIFYCPHTPDAGCECRKPKPGLLEQVARRLNIRLTGVPMVGDSPSDLAAARAAGAMPVLVLTGRAGRAAAPDPAAADCPTFPDLAAFAHALLEGQLDEHIARAGSTDPHHVPA